jgi:pimeloyl-ACP methyl ester carboxylesterase
VQDHFTEVHGVTIHWIELGAGDSTPVVLLHGLNNSALSWSRIAPMLATDRRVLIPDLPGHGDSGRPDAGYELHWYAQLMAGWMKAVGLESADVVGHSFGGGVAQMLLLECPERVRRLVLVASGGLGKDVGVWLRLASLPHLVEHLGQPFMALGTRLALHCVRDSLTPKDIEDLIRFNSRSGSARAFARTVRDVIDWRGQRRNFLHHAHEVGPLPPVLVLWGDSDSLIPIEQGRAFSELLEGSVFQAFEGAGHYLHNEQPERFGGVVRAFLDDAEVPAPQLRLNVAA